MQPKRRPNVGRAGMRPTKAKSPAASRPSAAESEPRELRWLGWALVAGSTLLIAWIALRLHVVGDYHSESDFYGGFAEGARLAQTGRLDPARHTVYGPVFEVLLAIVGLVTRDFFTAARVLSIAAAGVCLATLLVFLSRRVGHAAGFWGVAFLASNGTFIRYGISATTDLTAVAFQSVALCVGFASRWRHAALVAGLLSGLAVLTRYSAAAWSLGLAAAFFVADPKDRARGLRSSLVFIAGLALLVAPWTAYSLSRGHLPGEMLVRGYSYFYGNPDASRNIQDRPTSLEAPPGTPSVSPMRSQSVLARLAEHARGQGGALLGWPVTVVCGVGVILALRRRRGPALAPLLLAGALQLLAVLPVFFSTRYTLALLLPFAGLAALVGEMRGPALRLAHFRLPLVWLLLPVPLFLTARTANREVRYQLSQMPVEVLSAGRALRSVASADSRVMSRKGHVGYYAGVATVAFPRLSTVPELAAYCRRAGVDFLFFSWYEAELRPEFWALLDTTQVLPGLTVVHVTEQHPSVLYRVGASFGEVPPWFADESQRNLQASRAIVRVLDPPLAWEAHLNLGADAVGRGDFELAAEHFRLATRASQGRERGLMGWAEVRLRTNHPLDAVQAFKEVLMLNPGNRNARERLGIACIAGGDLRGAADAWRPLVAETRDPRQLSAMLTVFEQVGETGTADAIRLAIERAGGAQPH